MTWKKVSICQISPGAHFAWCVSTTDCRKLQRGIESHWWYTIWLIRPFPLLLRWIPDKFWILSCYHGGVHGVPTELCPSFLVHQGQTATFFRFSHRRLPTGHVPKSFNRQDIFRGWLDHVGSEHHFLYPIPAVNHLATKQKTYVPLSGSRRVAAPEIHPDMLLDCSRF